MLVLGESNIFEWKGIIEIGCERVKWILVIKNRGLKGIRNRVKVLIWKVLRVRVILGKGIEFVNIVSYIIKSIWGGVKGIVGVVIMNIKFENVGKMIGF